MLRSFLFVGAAMLAACAGTDPGPDPDTDQDSASPVVTPTAPWTQAVQVTLDGVAVAGIQVLQGGTTHHLQTDADGRAMVPIDPTIQGDLFVVAAHPQARSLGVEVDGTEALVTLDLIGIGTDDDPDYLFQDPGTPERRFTTEQCSHCHVPTSAEWLGSRHAASASNPLLHAIYSGRLAAADSDACAALGGTWADARAPGGGTAPDCFADGSVLGDLDPTCGVPCDTPTQHGSCAACHAPGIDGPTGDRDLLDATGHAYDYGVHCDVCHKIRDVDLTSDAPGTDGRAVFGRPGEAVIRPGFLSEPTTFGPNLDVLNPRMGAVYTPLFTTSTLCAACHESTQAALVPGTTIDTARWPSGRIPVHTTYSELMDGPLADVVRCQSCHMPPNPTTLNGAEIENSALQWGGVTFGWFRPPGAIRQHTWSGPRDPDVDMLGLALTLDLSVTETLDDTTATVQIANQGPGHAVPTGEPLRSVILAIDATCDGSPLPVRGGDATPGFAGALEVREAGVDWSTWPDAEDGDVVRIIRVDGWWDYAGWGPFGDGTFAPEAKGLPRWEVLEEVPIVGGTATLTTTGDLAIRGNTTYRAGAPGFAFARVLSDGVDAMVPHHRATDVLSDNRILPSTAWTSTHRFDPCPQGAAITARALWRGIPPGLADRLGQPLDERVMTEVQP